MTVAIREADDGDRTFVVENWLDSFRTAYGAGLIQMDDWYDVMRPQLQKALARPGVRTLVAYETDEPDRVADLYGFLVFDPALTDRHVTLPMVLYVYVKAPYRKWGYARRLFAAAGIDPHEPFFYACRTEAVGRLAHKIPRAKWQPLPARFPKQQTERRER